MMASGNSRNVSSASTRQCASSTASKSEQGGNPPSSQSESGAVVEVHAADRLGPLFDRSENGGPATPLADPRRVNP